MKRLSKLYVSLLLVLTLILSNVVLVHAASATSSDVIDAFFSVVRRPESEVSSISKDYGWNYRDKQYERKDGGSWTYAELTGLVTSSYVKTAYTADSSTKRDPIVDPCLDSLTTGAKNEFLTDYYNAAQSVIDASKANKAPDANLGQATEETMTVWLNAVQKESGVGSQLMTTLMSQTKPDYVTANRLYAPFSGIVGTVLGVVSILIMAMLSITMVLDIAYMTIPAMRLFCDEGSSNGDGKGSGFAGVISNAAKSAVQEVEGGGGGSGQSGSSNKQVLGIYLKKRILMLVMLGICLLYLVSGNIFSLVGWIIDLLSGFLGF